MTIQYITRKGSFDSAHRVMNERVKCFNIHGHTYLYELTFSFEQMQPIGYAIDFKEIKRIGAAWIDEYLDHASILNPKDADFISAVHATRSKFRLMSLNRSGEYCNPTVENIAKEIFLTMEVLFSEWDSLKIHHVRLYETPNCFTDCNADSIHEEERNAFLSQRFEELKAYSQAMGRFEYDSRNIVTSDFTHEHLPSNKSR
ncbi:queuosine biosynthesis protein [Photorhabdus luminescens]|uniref:6-carboxy-5,6,7,8-tetrahydropterin synthase n=1 Tax=Photorhabdus akhurstii TaxID=171438 RepID=A0ABX8LXC2_9GAMM|nr:6-carboxytetrahydropterin synthase [Photorhabdus akhurstii]KGM29333.1 queuosine biosynthesis protein [Photorhabdus luminescens]QXF34176.1 queuosine biosynthesis protein [Photorhabdus akhurstii]UJD75996.1 queuosine biosynthesis protein [Photorhabdus luminescens]